MAGASNLYADISGWLEPCGEAFNGDREALKRTFRSNGNALNQVLKGDEETLNGDKEAFKGNGEALKVNLKASIGDVEALS